MGYRNYIGSLPRKEYDKIKDFTKEELYKYKNVDKDDYLGVFDLKEKELYEFGKYCDFARDFFKPVFSNKELQEDYNEEQDCYLVEKDFLKHVIEHYTKQTQDFYLELVKNSNNNVNSISQQNLEKLFAHIRSMSSEWNYLTPFKLDEGESITTSWKYEYAIFELVRLYKHFDWENNVVIYYGY